MKTSISKVRLALAVLTCSMVALATACSSSGSADNTASSQQTTVSESSSSSPASVSSSTESETGENSTASTDEFSTVEDGVITVAYTVGMPNIGPDESGAMIGVVPELIRAFAADNDLTVDYFQTSFAGSITAVQSGRADVAGGIFYSDERAEAELFTAPYLRSGSFMAIKKGSEYTTPESVKGHKIGVAAGFEQVKYMQNLVGADNVVEFQGTEEGIQALRAGRIVGFVSGSSIVASVNKDDSLEAVRQGDSSWGGMPESLTNATNSIIVSCDNAQLGDVISRYVAAKAKSGDLGTWVREYGADSMVIDDPQPFENKCAA